jgi:penicillin-binding protein 2
VLYAVAAAMLISLGGRLWYLQVMNTTAFTKLAAANQTRNVIVPAVRGQILDDVGNRLVTNKTALVVSVDMMNLSQQPGGATPVLHRLAPLLGVSYQLLSDKTRLCTKGVPRPRRSSRWSSTRRRAGPTRLRCSATCSPSPRSRSRAGTCR